MDIRSWSKAKSINTEIESDAEVEEQDYATYQDDLGGSADTEDDDEMEDSATDGGEVEPSVRPRRPLTTTDYILHHPSSDTSTPPPSLSRITDTYPVRRPSFPSTTDGTSTRTSLPPSPPSKVAKERKSYNSSIQSSFGVEVRANSESRI